MRRSREGLPESRAPSSRLSPPTWFDPSLSQYPPKRNRPMPEKIEALGILLVLLPGFACAYIVQFLAVRRKQSELDKVIEALLFSLFLYVFTLPFFGYTLPLGWRSVDSQHPDVYQVFVAWKHFAWLTAGSVLIAIIYSANINHDWAMSVLRWMRVTERTGRKTIWNDAFQETGGMV